MQFKKKRYNLKIIFILYIFLIYFFKYNFKMIIVFSSSHILVEKKMTNIPDMKDISRRFRQTIVFMYFYLKKILQNSMQYM